MDIISFDALRTIGFPSIHYIKPDCMLQQQSRIRQADGVIFPEYWQLTSLVFGLGKKIFPSLSSYLIGHNKIEMTRCFQLLEPHHVPLTLIYPNTPESAELIWSTLPLPFVAKLPRSSRGEGVFLIETPSDWRAYCARTDSLYAQEFLPIDRDLRIIWVGKQVVGGYWRLQSPDGFHNNVAQGGQVFHGPIPVQAIELVERLATRLGIDHGGFDIAMIEDYPFVFEFNRLFGNQGLSGGQAVVDEAIMAYLAEQWLDNQPFLHAPEVQQENLILT